MRKTICLFITVFFILCSLALPVFAESGETTGTVTSSFTPSMESVMELIENIDETNPDADAVAEARSMYEQLTMAQKTQVTNIDKLIAAEEALRAAAAATPVPETEPPATTPQPGATEDGEGQKSSTKYTLRISEYKKSAAVVITHTTDSDGDGVLEAPRITLTSPDGVEIIVEYDETAVHNSLCEIDIERSETQTVLKIAQADYGTWTVQTSNRVLFRAEDYTPSDNGTGFQEVIPGATEPPSQPSAEKKSFPISFIIVPLVAVAAIVFIKKLPSIMDSGSNKGAKQRKTPKNTVTVRKEQEQEQDEYDGMSDDEVIKAIKAEWERVNPKIEERPAEKTKQPKIQDDADPRLFFTQEAKDVEDMNPAGSSHPAVEPLNTGSSFFARSNGSSNSDKS